MALPLTDYLELAKMYWPKVSNETKVITTRYLQVELPVLELGEEKSGFGREIVDTREHLDPQGQPFMGYSDAYDILVIHLK